MFFLLYRNFTRQYYIKKIQYPIHKSTRFSTYPISCYNRKSTIVRAGIVEYSELIGKSLILFVFFTTTLNWIYYKNLREEIEKEKKNKK